MTMNNEAYTAYPAEDEVLLSDGCPMFVLSVDKGFKITNTGDGEMSEFDGKVITIVHLYHAH